MHRNLGGMDVPGLTYSSFTTPQDDDSEGTMTTPCPWTWPPSSSSHVGHCAGGWAGGGLGVGGGGGKERTHLTARPLTSTSWLLSVGATFHTGLPFPTTLLPFPTTLLPFPTARLFTQSSSSELLKLSSPQLVFFFTQRSSAHVSAQIHCQVHHHNFFPRQFSV